MKSFDMFSETADTCGQVQVVQCPSSSLNWIENGWCYGSTWVENGWNFSRTWRTLRILNFVDWNDTT